MKSSFALDKAAQVAHFFISQGGGQMEILKLVKLIYLADRLSLEMRRAPIVGGTYYALPHGPITSEVLNLINEGTREGNSRWEQLISARADHQVAVHHPLPEYDALAPTEIRLLEEIWQQFGALDKWALVDWTHQHCPEWSDPDGGRAEISARRLVESFAWNQNEVDDFEAELAAQARLQSLIS